jgi:hypothetical protein
MFFMRMRNHAKWLFVALAVVFVFSFVVAGVGSGSTGLGDMLSSFPLFGGGGGSSNPVKKAQKKVDKAGKDLAKLAPALHELGKAQVGKAQYADAEATYRRYLALRPSNATARRELGLAYKYEADISGAQLRAAESDVVQTAPSRLTGSLVSNPIDASVHQDAVSTATDLYTAYAVPKRKELSALAAAAKQAKGPDRETSLALTGSEAYSAAIEGYYFSAYVGESPQAASANTDEKAWAKAAVAALGGVLKFHANDSTTAQIKQQIAEMKQIAGLSGK